MTARIYVEGGGKSSWDECRRGFEALLHKAVPDELRLKIIPCGSRRAAYDDFRAALTQYPRECVLLLVDAEEPLRSRDGVWEHLLRCDRWTRPRGASDASAHLMVRVMEAWLLADPDALERFYGPGFQRKAAPHLKDVEAVPKRHVFEALARASRRTRRGAYHKTRHGFALLAEIDADRVRAAAPHFERLCRHVAALR